MQIWQDVTGHRISCRRNLLEFCWPDPTSNPILPLHSAQSFPNLLPHGHLHSHRVICMRGCSSFFGGTLTPPLLMTHVVFISENQICVFLTKRCIGCIQYIGLCGAHRRAAKGSDTALRSSSGSSSILVSSELWIQQELFVFCYFSPVLCVYFAFLSVFLIVCIFLTFS